MKIVVTGLPGHLSQLTKGLGKKRRAVTGIGRQAARRNALEALGTAVAIGSLAKAAFLAATFAGDVPSGRSTAFLIPTP